MSNSRIDQIIETIPDLRSFARSLSRDRMLVDDLVQETVTRALIHQDQFQAGTNLKAWLRTILRNCHFDELRRSGRMSCFSEMADHVEERIGVTAGGQESALEARDFMRAFRALPAERCQALKMVGAEGYSYKQAAMMAGCATGTMKSRVARARQELRSQLEPSAALPAPAAPAGRLTRH